MKSQAFRYPIFKNAEWFFLIFHFLFLVRFCRYTTKNPKSEESSNGIMSAGNLLTLGRPELPGIFECSV